MNIVVLSGNLTKNAKLLTTSTGKTCCITSLAVREDLRPEEKQPTFVDIVIWGARAEKLSSMLTKGKAISVTGRLEIAKTTKGEKIYVNPRVVVNSLEFLSKKEPVVAESSTTEDIDAFE
ncbi:MAG: single-stranded DNA-binding protein [Elusimicrobiota bacterium]|nr:single-stranded DNA-binding protein [Elusimicrobiota bacterium]